MDTFHEILLSVFMNQSRLDKNFTNAEFLYLVSSNNLFRVKHFGDTFSSFLRTI